MAAGISVQGKRVSKDGLFLGILKASRRTGRGHGRVAEGSWLQVLFARAGEGRMERRVRNSVDRLDLPRQPLPPFHLSTEEGPWAKGSKRTMAEASVEVVKEH